MLNSEFARQGCVIRHSDTGGDGVPVVFSHGAGADHVMFDAQRDHFAARGYRVLTWDMRGHGMSRPAGAAFTSEQAIVDLLALIEHVGLARPVLVGQSLGGNLSQAVVRREPDRFRGLVVIGSTWSTAPLSGVERMLLKSAATIMALVPAKRLPGMMADASAQTAVVRADLRRAFAQLTKAEFVEVWRATVGLLEPDPDYRTPIPLCLIRGEQDRTGNIATAMPKWATAEGIDEIVIPGAGHVANQDAPDAVNAAIDAFLSARVTV
ncbi:alpha/beta fold hydrolase [Diaminobutyricimonas sp. LJ205]|uniref:alpha/beta fold hydrolase n=1 Tax=Diaminobutyricimonas sp. LJ205 TaxID=2683590 RepID=UPI0012F509BD|nr:alpha/beta hydrolase [Diaminobutyricimonas sp. LJ205]